MAAGLYLAMELVSGGTLADLVAEVVSVPVPWVAAIGAQLCAAVDDAPHDPARLHSMAFGAIMAV